MAPLRTLLAVVAIAITAAFARELRLSAQGHFERTQAYEDAYYVPPDAWLPVFSLGYDEALADLLWMRALVYFGDELIHRGEVRHVFDYANAILVLDPDFRRVYAWAGTAGMYRPTETSLVDMYDAVGFLERGARRFPDDGALAWDLGASLAFELVPRVSDPTEKERLRAAGVAHMQVAARLGTGPDWLVLANATQLRRLGQTEQAIRHLEEMYAVVSTPDIKRQIEIEIGVLRGRAHADAMRQSREELEQRWLRDFPYLPETLYLLIGTRPVMEPDAPLLPTTDLGADLAPL
jgi:hypothetical protein